MRGDAGGFRVGRVVSTVIPSANIGKPEIAEVPGGLDVHRPGQARASGGINVTAHQSDGVNELRQAPKVIHVQMRDEDVFARS